MDTPHPSIREVAHTGREPVGITGLVPLAPCSQAALEGCRAPGDTHLDWRDVTLTLLPAQAATDYSLACRGGMLPRVQQSGLPPPQTQGARPRQESGLIYCCTTQNILHHSACF